MNIWPYKECFVVLSLSLSASLTAPTVFSIHLSGHSHACCTSELVDQAN